MLEFMLKFNKGKIKRAKFNKEQNLKVEMFLGNNIIFNSNKNEFSI